MTKIVAAVSVPVHSNGMQSIIQTVPNLLSSCASVPGDTFNGMDLFYKGWSGSGYANIVTEYSGKNGKNGKQASSSINYQGYVVDSSTPVTIDAGSILKEVCAQIPDPDPSGNGYYVEMKRDSACYCGWHSHGSCKGIPVQFGFIFNLDGDNACSAGPPPANPGWRIRI